MLDGFMDFLLADKKMESDTARNHYNRAKIVLGIKEKWSYEEAKEWISEKTQNASSTRNKWRQTFNRLQIFLIGIGTKKNS